jgi:NAD(P)-dependent dehydrogenase (short-subunit alcohol dehydrogenase family)
VSDIRVSNILGYANKRVIVTGCSSGMGRAAAKLLLELGAQVQGLDNQKSDLDLDSFRLVDLREPASLEQAVSSIGGKIDALFNCAGVGPTFSTIDKMKVNFIGTRHLTDLVLPLMGDGGAIASIASTAAMGWSRRIPVHKRLLEITEYDAAVRWAEDNLEMIGEGYGFSKEAIVVWTLAASQQLIKRGIRINCVLPGLTQTPMLTDQIAVKTSSEVLQSVIQPIGRAARPEEQAFPLVMINSAAASYLNGAALNVDGGRLALLAMRETEA